MASMLDGCTPWPEEFVDRYWAAGHWRGNTLDNLLRGWALEYGPRTALVHGGTRLTYANLNRRVDRTAAGFRLPPARAQTADQVAVFLLSGGTTAAPRLIPRTHNDYAYQARAAAESVSLTENDVYIAALPAGFHFTFGCPGIVGTRSVDGTVVLVENPGPAACLPAIDRERVTITSVASADAELWLDVLPTVQADLSSLRLVQIGGAPLPRATAERMGPQGTVACGRSSARPRGRSLSPGPPIRARPRSPCRAARSRPTTRSA